jgi:hypothetical protein
MPLTLTATEGVFAKGVEKEVFRELCQLMLKWHGLVGNQAMTPNVVGSIHLVAPEHTYSGLVDVPVVFVEWKVPSFAFATREIQSGYIADATRLVVEHSVGRRHPKERVWVNVLHAVDGAWGIAGQAMTNQQLGQAVSQG